jgi:hypothetical protein
VGGGEKLRQETVIVLVINCGIGFSFLSSRVAVCQTEHWNKNVISG